ncbi:hypothetical protein NN561_012009 [Cricetulus griseus]
MTQVRHLGTHAVFTGYMVLAQCQTLLASVGASCHSDHEDRGVNQQTRNGASPLYLACQEGHLHLAQFLVKDCGADVRLRALDGMSSLHAAAARGHYSLVVWLCCQTLLSHRVDPFLRDEDGYTAMDLADYHGHQDCAQYLREMSRPAAELVSENCEAYEAHMRDIRDYLEERLEGHSATRRHYTSISRPSSGQMNENKAEGRTLGRRYGHRDQSRKALALPWPALRSCPPPMSVGRPVRPARAVVCAWGCQ